MAKARQTFIPLAWIGSSRRDIKDLPDEVQDDFGHALRDAQEGGRSALAKPLSGFGDAGVLEIVERFDGDTYRAVYTVRFEGCIYVLHVFQKKSKRGSETPKTDIDLIRLRLRMAEREHGEWLALQQKRR